MRNLTPVLKGNAFHACKPIRGYGRFAACLRRFFRLWRKA